MKKKFSLSSQNKKDWLDFTKQPKNIYDKDKTHKYDNNYSRKIRKLDLHGFSLNDANQKVKKFIEDSFDRGYEKIVIVTGKGLRSKVYNDPYRSKDMNILRNSVPAFIQNDQSMLNLVKKISGASIKDGGDGAFYVLLKKKSL